MRKSVVTICVLLLVLTAMILIPEIHGTVHQDHVASVTSSDSAKSDTTSIPAQNFPAQNFISQIYNDTPPNDQIYNTTNPYTSFGGDPLAEVNETEGPITVNVLLAGDEEAQNTWYWVGSILGIIDIYYDWIDYSKFQIERADEALVAKYGIDLRIRGAVTWHSTDGISDPDFLNEEMMNQTGWDYSFNYNGYEIDVLFGVVGQTNYPYPGVTFPEYYGHGWMNTILVKWQVYWEDDNIVQHEFSHIFFTLDHITESDPGYGEDCIMSYRPQFIFFLSEDGYIWTIFNYVPTAGLTNNYCTTCNNRILSWKYHDINIDGRVNIKDLAIAANAFGSYPGHPRWNPAADINWDGKVDIIDVGMVSKNYGLVIW